jgi:pyruvate carboxylase subunit B
VKYCITIQGQEQEVEVNGDEIRLNGELFAARLISLPQTPLRQLQLDGSSRTYAMVGGGEGWSVLSGGEIHSALVEDERTRQLRKVTGQGDRLESGGLVKAPMPGMVLRLEVKLGQTVTQGSGVAVLEAMKMENEIKAPAAGVVSAILVEAGQAVDKGAVLVELAGE